MAHYVLNCLDCEICMSVTLMKSQLVIMPMLKGIPDVPDTPNQPTSQLQFTLKIVWEVKCSLQVAAWFQTELHYDKTNDKLKSTVPMDLKERSLKYLLQKQLFM